MTEDKLKHIKARADFVLNTMTKEDFTTSFKNVVDLVVRVQKELMRRIDDHIGGLVKRMNEEHGRIIERHESEYTALKEKIKNEIETRLNNVLKDFDNGVKKLSSEQQAGMNYLYDRVGRIRDGVDGEDGEDGSDGQDGKDADPKQVAALVLAELKPIIDEQLKKLEKENENRRRLIGQFGGGGTSAMGVQFALPRIVKKETPSGAINGSNAAFTVSQDIHTILNFTLNGQAIADDEYTVAGRTITLDTAPPADLSGTSFRITYV